MKTKAFLDLTRTPPVLRLSIFNAPHRRMHVSAIKALRQDVYEACLRAGIKMPIDYPIDLHVIFVDPVSPDNGNIYLALEQALDGATLSKKNAVLVDDALISETRIKKLYTDQARFTPEGKVKRKGS